MEKKFMSLITTLVIVFIGIVTWIYVSPAPDPVTSATMSDIDADYAERFFDKNKVIDIYITLEETDYKDILENPMAEEYKDAEITVDGVKVTHVGLRTKGNSSLNSVARDDSERYSFKVDFNQYIQGQSLSGLTKLNLNNSFSDPSFMREYLSYSLLNDMGVATPAFGYANLYINDELIGLYLAVEGLEEPFLESYYGSNYGTLYKPEGQGSDLIYVDDNIKSYSGIAPIAGYNNDSNGSLLKMLKALNEGTDLEKYLDIKQILKYFAVNTVLVNMDSYQSSLKHNYYLYEKDGIFTILPWDYNMSFGGFGMGGNNQDQTALYIDQPVSGTTLEQRPLLGKLLEVEEYKDMYHSYIEEFINGPFAADKMTAEIDRIANLIRPHIENDPSKFFTMEQFEQALDEGGTEDSTEASSRQPSPQGEANFKGGGNIMTRGNVIGLSRFIQERLNNVTQQLSGEIPSYGEASSQVINIFADQSPGGNPPEGFPKGREFPQNGEFPAGGEFPRGGEFPDREGFAGGRQLTESETGMNSIYLTVGLITLLGAVIFLLFRKKNKHQI
ncbi:MAG: hypothetical protein APF84_09195 [Gracilibacter sp. BRH_c7a]|nr:MAG: hypothetical protein APF84_09195 [Gracilibacter sp. BRH_c7a]